MSEGAPSPVPAKVVSKQHNVQDLQEDDVLQIFRADLHELVNSAVQSALLEPAAKRSKDDDDEEDMDNSAEGKYVQGKVFSDMLVHIQEVLGFDPKTLSDEGFYAQYSSSVVDDLPFHDVLMDILTKEWLEVDKQGIPRFLGKRYQLAGFNTQFPAIPKLNSLLSSMASASSSCLSSEEASLSDPVERKVESALKRSYAASHFRVRASTYAANASQVLLKDCEKLFDCRQDQGDPTPVLAQMEILAQFLSDVTFDSLWAFSSAAGSAVAGRRSLWTKPWCLEAAQKSLVHKLPFEGPRLFGDALNAMVQRSAEKMLKPFQPLPKKKSFFHKQGFQGA